MDADIAKLHIRKLHALSEFIIDKKQDILEDWKNILAEEDDQISKLVLLSKARFYNHIPIFIDAVGRRLRAKNETIELMARLHGAE